MKVLYNFFIERDHILLFTSLLGKGSCLKQKHTLPVAVVNACKSHSGTVVIRKHESK